MARQPRSGKTTRVQQLPRDPKRASGRMLTPGRPRSDPRQWTISPGVATAKYSCGSSPPCLRLAAKVKPVDATRVRASNRLDSL